MTLYNEGAIVLDMLESTGPSSLDDLVTDLAAMSWAKVFVAIDRMSREGRLLLRQVGYSSY